MSEYLMVCHPGANRVFNYSLAQIAAAEMKLSVPGVEGVCPDQCDKRPAVRFFADSLDETAIRALSSQGSCYLIFEKCGSHYRLVDRNVDSFFDDDLLTIAKYAGKTNEILTTVMVNVALATSTTRRQGRYEILDPLAGRGTTLFAGLIAGCNVWGVEKQESSFRSCQAYITTYLRQKRYKHRARLSPVKRDGKRIAQRLDVELNGCEDGQKMSFFCADAQMSAALMGKKKVDAIITDAPYGVVHGSLAQEGERRRIDRKAEDLLSRCLPVWAGQLKAGGSCVISWNRLSLRRERLEEMFDQAGLVVEDRVGRDDFLHRVDSSIERDVIVAHRPK